YSLALMTELSWVKYHRSIDNRLTSQLPLQNLANNGGVRFALAQLHHLAFEEIQRGGFARSEIACRTWIGGDDFVTELFNRACIADLSEAFFLNDGGGGFAGVEHLGEDLLRGG